MKVAIGVPHRSEYDYREWRESYRNRLLVPEGTIFIEHRNYELCTMRNMIAEEALRSGAEYLFFLDDDIIGPDNGLMTLLAISEHFKEKFISGLYWAKKNQNQRSLAAWKRLEDQPTGNEAWAKKVSTYGAITFDQVGQYVFVDAVGLGFSLIHRSILEQLPRPWFKWEIGGVSEDFYFCEQVKAKLHISPLVDMKLGCSHIGTFKILPDGSFDMLQM